MRLKAIWIVTAGIIPDERRNEFTKRWEYTSADYENDSKIKEPWEVAVYSKLRAEAMDYFLQVSDHRVSNWAKLEFVWL